MMSTEFLLPSHTVYVVDDCLFGPVFGFEDRARAAERLEETWRFLSEPKPGIAFPRTAAGYAFKESNCDIAQNHVIPIGDDRLRHELPFAAAVQVYVLADRVPGQSYRLSEPQLEIFRKAAGGYEMELEENVTLREFLATQSLETGDTYGPLHRIRVAPMEVRTVHDAHLETLYQAALDQGLKCIPAIEAAIAEKRAESDPDFDRERPIAPGW